MAFFSKNPAFDKTIDKATSHLLLEPDWASNILACDMIRQGEVTGKYAIQSVKKKLNHTNPHVILYALNLVEAMAKNCGSNVHDEIASQDFMNQMKTLTKEKDPVKSKALELIQLWAFAFRNQSKYNLVQGTYNSLKSSGFIFQPIVESDAMFISENAPEWQDSDSCYRCKVVFSTLRRKTNFLDKFTKGSNMKHHCRNCGNIFCDECTAKRSNIPKYGIEKDVRVCDACFDQLKGISGRSGRNKKGVQFNEDVTVRNMTAEPKQEQDTDATRIQKEKELELQEKEELELAMALSASEAESQGAGKGKSSSVPRQQQQQQELQPTPANQAGFNGMYSTLDTSEMDPELARYLNRNYWENKASSVKVTTQPSAPTMPSSPGIKQQSIMSGTGPTTSSSSLQKTATKQQSDVSNDQEEFLAALRSSIEIFVNRMQSNMQRGRSIANDSSVQTLFLTLNAMHPQLLQYVNDQDDKRNYYESLQDKLAQLRDAREALDALREEHKEKQRREQEEAARVRQMQMMQKLEVMRQKKKEYLDYQRQLAVDRMQQQERDMAMRMAQQQQQMQMRQYQQQYPYSMQQQQPDQGPMMMSMMPGTTQYPPAGTNVGLPSVSNMGPPAQAVYQPADFYNMQGMAQTLPLGNRGAEVPNGGMLHYMAPPAPNDPAHSITGQYNPAVQVPNQPPSQSQQPPTAQEWSQPNQATVNAAPSTTATNNNQPTQPPVIPELQRQQQAPTEDQLISFD